MTVTAVNTVPAKPTTDDIISNIEAGLAQLDSFHQTLHKMGHLYAEEDESVLFFTFANAAKAIYAEIDEQVEELKTLLK